jgi:predicted phage terminase large subunit-like protein
MIIETSKNSAPPSYSPSRAAEILLERQAAKRSLIAFTDYTFPAYVAAEHHKLIAAKLEAVERGEIDRLMINMPPRHGKALAIDTPIATPSGWARIGDLRPGDKVFGDTGECCNVVAVSEVWRNRPVYRVITDDGDEIIADAEHEWLVRLCRKRPVFRLKTTKQLAERTSSRAPMIAAQGALHLPHVDLPVDPYVFGVWLGDGRTDSSAICSADDELIDEIARIEGDCNEYAPSGRTRHVRIGPHYRNGATQAETLQGRLRALGVLGAKRIPTMYARASTGQRLSLLQGLVDTDGYVAADGQIEFCSTSAALADDVKELVHSLGHKASIIVGRAVCNGKDCGPKYRVMFYMAGAARLKRKAVKTRHGARAFRRYVTFEPAGIADTVCIEVDSASHMFLAGKSMLPTHNSELASRRFPAWFLGRHPDRSIIAASYNSDLATDFGRQVRNIIASEEFGRLFDVGLSDDSRAANRWNTAAGGGYVAAGVGTAITGRGADILLIDDPLKDREEADSELQRNKVWDWYTSTAYTRLAPGGRIIVIQTRWHEDDLSGRLLADEARGGDKWDVLELPAINDAGEALWPDFYPLPVLERYRSVLPARDWSALYQQRPTPDEGDYFKREWFRYYDTVPQHLRTYGASDYAVTAKGGDYTVHIVAGVDPDDNLYVLDVWRSQAESHVWVETYLDLIARWKPLKWAQEQGQIIKSLGPFIDRRMRERRIYCAQEPMTSVADKPTRSRSFQARAAMGKVYLPHNAPWVADLVGEMLTFPAGKHDDQVDALGLIGRMMDTMVSGRKHVATEQPDSKWRRAFAARQNSNAAGSWKVA